jgi:hypothetical protein
MPAEVQGRTGDEQLAFANPWVIATRIENIFDPFFKENPSDGHVWKAKEVRAWIGV